MAASEDYGQMKYILGKIDDVACVVILAKTFTVGVSGGHFGYEEYIESYVKT